VALWSIEIVSVTLQYKGVQCMLIFALQNEQHG
jgi:hypothetical protein